MEDWKSYIKLCSIPDIGSITAMRLLEAFGSPGGVFAASKSDLLSVPKIGVKTAEALLAARDSAECEKIFARMSEIGAKYVHFNDPRYPRRLLPLADKPVGFYFIGDCDFNALIRDGATLAMSAEDIIDELRSTGQVELDFSAAESPEEPAPEKPSAALPLSEDESRVLKCMDSSRVSYADEISERSGMEVQKCLAVLLMLEIRKIVKKSGGGWIL